MRHFRILAKPHTFDWTPSRDLASLGTIMLEGRHRQCTKGQNGHVSKHKVKDLNSHRSVPTLPPASLAFSLLPSQRDLQIMTTMRWPPNYGVAVRSASLVRWRKNTRSSFVPLSIVYLQSNQIAVFQNTFHWRGFANEIPMLRARL